MEPGHRIEHYVVIEKIGQGGQAAVWSAYDERLKRTVAVKTISLASFDSAEKSGTAQTGASALTTPDRFREEAQIIAALEHPNILPIYAFGQEGDSLYIIMRYMAAGSLKDLLKHGRLSLEKTLTLIEPLASALDLAHQNQIIHRDIKSANVLLDAHHNPYLADFGLSMTIGDKNSLAGVGTLAYMSPEQMMGDPLDHCSDLYAFGILIYEVLVGQLPKVNEQPWNLQQAMAQAPLPIPADMPPAIADVLRRATALEPANRYQSASEITAALRATLMAGAPVEEALLITDPALLALKEANDLFDKAQERWSDGAGRFRLEAGDFKYIDSFYSAPENWDLHLDDVARRLMLRAALEHGHNLDYWWSQLDDVADQRAVSLQTLTSDLAPARIRAFQRLSTIEDSDPPAIPIRVASVIAAEPDSAVRLAGIALLEQRALPLKEWRFAAFSEVIDGVLADLAAHDPDPKVAEAAARACARLYSTSAVTHLAYLAAGGDRRALHALTYVREEIPAFPDGVPASIRRQVFTALSWRQLLADPLGLIGRYVGASLGYGLGLGLIVYVQFVDPNGLLAAQRIGNALAVGALYGVLTGVGILAATEPAARLRAWTRPGRIALSWVLGALLTTAAFILFQRYFYFENAPDWKWFLAIAGVFVSGFAISSGLTRRAWIRSVAGAIGALLAVYLVSWQIGFFNQGSTPVIMLSEFQDDVSLVLSAWLAIALGLFTFLPEGIRAAWKRVKPS
jgi:serine/threonine protein kinase